MTVYGYARVSTLKQKIERQIANIKAQYPDAAIIAESYTGTTTDRPKFNNLLKAIKPGDILVFDEVSRMSRNASEGFALYQELYNKGVHLVFLKEPHLNTDVYKSTLENQITMTGTDIDVILQGVNQYLMILAQKQIEIAFGSAQHEVDFMRKRTSEGVRRAQAEGKQVGRAQGAQIETKKAREMKDKIRKLSKDFDGSLSDKECLDILQIARNTYYKYKSQLREDHAANNDNG